jgi:insertion element IS1 protein InsB
LEVGYAVVMDEFWSFVKRKKNQRWTWYAIEKQTGIIISWHNGKRTDWDLRILMGQVQEIPIKKYYTDHLNFYKKTLMDSEHIVGKANTWKIERKNLNFRTHLKRLNRRTICYSKNEEIHDNVIGMYIERFYYKSGIYYYNRINGFDP